MTIRTATTADIPAIQQLCTELMRRMEELEPQDYLPAPYADGLLEEVLANREKRIFVAETEEGVVGYAYAELKETPAAPFLKPRRFVYFNEFSVSPACRGLGVGRELFAALEAWARAEGAEYVELMALTANERAVALYERLGFRNIIKTMRLEFQKD